MDLSSAMTIAAAGMRAQSARLRVTAENLANARIHRAGRRAAIRSAARPSASPSRRDRGTGLELVDVGRYGEDRGDFELRYQPGHPAADAAGYVKYPNVNPLIELVDMREAQRSYEANLNALQLARHDDRAHARPAALSAR